MSHQGNDEIIDNERDNLCEGFAETYEPTINPKDYPNVSGIFGNYEYDKECDNYVKIKSTKDQKEDQIITCPTCSGDGEIIERREEER